MRSWSRINAVVSGIFGGGLAATLLLSPAPVRADPDPLNVSRLPPQVIYDYGQNDSARSAAMGGALRALGTGTSAVLLNPASLVETHVYRSSALVQFTPETRRQMYGATVADSVTGALAGSVAVMGGYMDPEGLKRTVFDVRVGFAYSIGDRLFVGLGGRYSRITQNAINLVFPNDAVSGGLIKSGGDATSRSPFVNALTFDAGLTFKASENFYIAAVGQNLTNPKNGLLPTTFGGGIGITSSSFSIEADGLADLNSWGKPTARIMGGAEYVIADHVPIRLGYRFDQGATLHWITGGLGYTGTQFAMDAAVKRTVSKPGETALLLSFEYFFEASGLINTNNAQSQ